MSPTESFQNDDPLQTSRLLRLWLPEIPERPLLDHYELPGRELGKGGYGTVTVGRKRHLPQQVAIKRIHTEFEFSEVHQRRFVREVQLLAPLRHPNIVQVEDWGRDDQGLYIVMELIDGPNLCELLRQHGPRPAEQLLDFARQICRALGCAHQHGIVHRDLKPANLLLDPHGFVKLADFGLAREASDVHQQLTSSHGAGLYTFAYASPEQLRGDHALDGRSDLYSLGATLYHLAMGRADTSRVFDLDNLPAAHGILRPLLSALLQPNRDQRPADAAAALQLVEQAQAGLRGTAEPAGGRPPITVGLQSPPSSTPPQASWAGILAELRRKVSAQHELARQWQQQQRYAEAVAALEEIPFEHRHLVDQSLYQTCVRLRDQVQTLEKAIDAAVKSLRYEGLREQVEQLQQLQPWREDLRGLLETLPKTPPPPAKPQLLTAPFDAAKARAAQAALAEQLRQPEEWTNSVGMTFRLIPDGTFRMGSPNGGGFDGERPQHRVTISKAFRLGIHTVTQGQWLQVMGTAPWTGRKFVKEGSNVAATYVSWDDAMSFCQRLSAQDGRRYRLPTEAEWEWCCRAGTTTKYSFGDDEEQLSKYAWWGGTVGDGNCRSEQYAHCVGQKLANPFGLYDLHGNVREWCQDWKDDGFYGQSSPTDPSGPAAGTFRVLRGGGWYDGPFCLRSSYRFGSSPGASNHYTGFRLLLELSEFFA